MALIDPATGWFEISELPEKENQVHGSGNSLKIGGWQDIHAPERSFLTMVQNLRKTSYLA